MRGIWPEKSTIIVRLEPEKSSLIYNSAHLYLYQVRKTTEGNCFFRLLTRFNPLNKE